MFTEQEEADVVNAINKHATVDIRNTIFKIRKDIVDELRKKNLPKEAIDNIVGKLAIRVREEDYGNPIYDTVLELSTSHIAKVYALYKEELSEEIFYDMCNGLIFFVPFKPDVPPDAAP